MKKMRRERCKKRLPEQTGQPFLYVVQKNCLLCKRDCKEFSDDIY